jgi:hypothetical protein
VSIRSTPEPSPRKRRDIARPQKTPITMGDLIVALTEETRRYVQDDDEVYRLVAYMVTDILDRSSRLSKNCN